MKQKKISAYQLSKETGIGQATISSWKTGRCKPKTDKLEILAKYFEVDIKDLL